MRKTGVLVGLVVVGICSIGLLTGCGDSGTNATVTVKEAWYGFDTLMHQGSEPDTFSLKLTLYSNSTFTMMRSGTTHPSSTVMPDSIKLEGTYTTTKGDTINGDTITFTPGSGKCTRYVFSSNSWVTVGTQPAMTFIYPIAGSSVWNIQMTLWTDSDVKLHYPCTKITH